MTRSVLQSRAMSLLGIMLGSVFPVLAAIPENQDPTQGAGNGNLLTVLFAYGYDVVLYGGGLLLAAAVAYYVIHLWGIFKEVRAERKEKSDLISDAVIGAAMIGLSIWAVNFCLSLLEKAT